MAPKMIGGGPVLEVETLRDRFAMAALTGWLANGNLTPTTAWLVMRCYVYADAMMKERKKAADDSQ